MAELLPIAELDELIRAGWGDVKRSKIPENWRDHTPPETAAELGRKAYHSAAERRQRHAAAMRSRVGSDGRRALNRRA